MQNTYQEKIADLDTNNALVRKKLEGGIKFKIKSSFKPSNTASVYKYSCCIIINTLPIPNGTNPSLFET